MLPFAAKVTVPFVPWVTALTTRPPFSKLSALPPPTPVSALKVIEASSLTETVSETMSATGVTLIATVSVSEAVPSLVTTVRLNGVEGDPVL